LGINNLLCSKVTTKNNKTTLIKVDVEEEGEKMKKLIKLTKTKLFGAIAILAIFMPMIALADLSPVLDSEDLYKIANRSNAATWGTSATADPGQTLSFLVHVHNDVLETTANNVRVQAVISSGEVTSYTSMATARADNASPVSGTTSYTFSSPATLEYIPGSTVLYNHFNQVEKNLPDGITTGGVNLGLDLQGCWEYEKWVIFQAKVVAKENPKNPTLYYCTSSSACTSTDAFANIDNCVLSTNKPCYATREECLSTASKYCPLINPPITDPPKTIVSPAALPVTGPFDLIAGTFATIGIGTAGYLYGKGRNRLRKAQKNIK